MNNTLLKIMEFINNNTLLLIGICVFLILVLVGYLIDNSVKSKRIRKDIKNAAQVPENIKNEIIKEAEEKEKTLTNAEVQNTTLVDSTIQTPVENNNSENIVQIQPEVNNETIQNSSVINEDKIDNGLDVKLDLDSTNTSMGNIDNKYIDPDINIMGTNNEYSNDKKLSEILNNVNNVIINEPSNDMFSNNIPNIQINTDVDKNDVKIETDDTSDELDRIMKKLSNINSSDEDSYTNIF